MLAFNTPFSGYKFELPARISEQFKTNQFVVGGRARVAAHCYFNDVDWPSNYSPRDEDYLLFVDAEDGQIQSNEGWEGTDVMCIRSFEDYCQNIDLHTNSVGVHNGRLFCSKEARSCFLANEILINPGHRMYHGSVSQQDYLILRACIQTGLWVPTHRYVGRFGAVGLGSHLTQLVLENKEELMGNWYYPTYLSKMEQVVEKLVKGEQV